MNPPLKGGSGYINNIRYLVISIIIKKLFSTLDKLNHKSKKYFSVIGIKIKSMMDKGNLISDSVLNDLIVKEDKKN